MQVMVLMAFSGTRRSMQLNGDLKQVRFHPMRKRRQILIFNIFPIHPMKIGFRNIKEEFNRLLKKTKLMAIN
jgi:hypothetical protein